MRHLTSAFLTGFTLLMILASCGGDRIDIDETGTRAVLIGIDGADWKLIEEIGASGGMPNLLALRERGSWGPLETLHDIPLSPVIWTSIATGKTAAKHGVSWFMVDRPDGTRVPVRSHNRKAKAIWNLLAEARRKPNVVGWWATYPAEEVGQGVIVSDGLGFHGFGSTARGGDDSAKTYPSSRFADFDALVPALQQIPYSFISRFVHLTEDEYRAEMFDPARFPELNPFNPIHLFQQYAATAQGYEAVSHKLLDENQFDLSMLYFEQVDSFSHLFMKYDPPRLEWVDEAPYARYKDVVREWYRYQDEIIGRLLERIDLESTAVFVVSDHGFKSSERRIRSEDTVDIKRAHLDHETDGIYIAAGPHIRPRGRVAGAAVMDIAPTLLHYLGFPVARDMDGKVLDTTFLPSFMDEHPIRYIATYEDGDGAESTETEEYDLDEAKKNERALRALGYLSGGDKAEDKGIDTGSDEESSPEMHNNMGRVHLRNGELDKARSEFRQALDLDPRNADALLNLASIQAAEGRNADAELLIKRALQVNPDSIGALSQLAELERDRGNLDEAIRLFEVAMEIDDSLPFLYQGYGDVLQRARRFEGAEEAFKMVLQLDPDSFKAHYNLGVTYGNQRRIDEAIAEYESALEIAPTHPEASLAHNNLGAIALDRGLTDEAMGHFEKSVGLAPRHLESRYNLALIYMEKRRIEDAVEMLEAATRIDPNHELVNVRLGLAYLEAGRGEDAFRTFTLVRRLYPRNWVAPLGLAVLHAANQRPDEARGLLDSAFELGGEQARQTARSYPVLAEMM